MRREAENWFRQSKADLKTAKDCLDTANYYAVAFFSQQAIEKALKAYYVIKKKMAPPRTHNLLELSLKLEVPEEYLTMSRELTPEFIITRYPDAAGGPPFELYDERSAREILTRAKRFFEWLERKIGV